MADKKEDKKDRRPEQREKKRKSERNQAVEVICTKCHRSEIIYMPKEDIPRCPDCDKKMVINEILTEGKSY